MPPMKFLLIAMISIAAAFTLPAAGLQAAMTVEMDVQPRVIRVGEPAELRFTIRNADEPQPPPLTAINGLQINGPSVGNTFNSSMVNGRFVTDRATIFTYQIIALQEGEFQIGPYACSDQKETVNVPAIALKALSPRAVDAQGGVQNGQQSPALFARLSAEKTTLFNQEVFDLVMEIFYRGDINIGREISLLNMPATGLSLQPFEEINPSREVVNNEIFEVRRFRCKAHALTAGTFTLNPTLRIPLIVPRQRTRQNFFDDPFADMFGGMRAQPVDITPDPLNLTIVPLPEQGKPINFSGAVGQLDMQVDVKPTELEAGEPITVTTLISGTGNIDLISPPTFRENDLFKAYETRRIENNGNGGNTAGQRTFEQVVIPKSDQASELPALSFSYFDPQSSRYETIQRGPFALTVRPSTKSTAQLIQAAAPGSASQAKLLGSDLVYLKPAPAVWTRTPVVPLYHNHLFQLAVLFPPCALALLFFLLRRKTELQTNQAKARRLRAPKSARAGLRKAEHALKNNRHAEYYDGLWEALSSYFGDRLNLAPGEIASSQVLELCRNGGMPQEQTALLQRLFEQCDECRFGAVSSHRSDPDALTSDLKAVPALLKAAERIRL